MKRLVLIDGHAILHRAYHAFPKNLKTRRGEIVNAVYGFSKILLNVIKELKPTHLAVTFDLPQPTFRQEIFVAYQYKRPAMDAELKNQIERVKQVVKALAMPIFEKAGFEADDLIGTLAKQAERKKIKTIIVTGDKDLMQLVTAQTKLYLTQSSQMANRLVGSRKVKTILGVNPNQVVDYKALVGDSSDNYPGVPGVGPKTAVQLLDQYQTLATIFKKKTLQQLRANLAEKLRAGQESADLSQKLAQIMTNVPIKLNLKKCRIHEYDQEKAIRLFEELEFKSLIYHLPGVEKEAQKRKPKPKNKQMKLVK